MKMIPDLMWNEIENLIPKRKSKVGRPETSAKLILNGIAFVLKTGIQWRYLPKEFGPPSTVHGRFRKWIKMGVFKKIMEKANEFYCNRQNTFIWFSSDTSHCKAPLANKWGGRNPTDRGKNGVKKSLIVDIRGAPLAVHVGPSNKHDSTFFEETFNRLQLPKYDGARIMAADAAYDCQKLRDFCKKRNFALLAATNVRRSKKKIKYSSPRRWVVERTFGWLAWYRSLKICWTRTKHSFLAFFSLAASVHLFKMEGIFV